ncbi:hypothetical protein B4110_3406 [Parageobacillus toebii]|uniref:Uncharacterized protein n=1 Tax=Parageobacillus toebii TaxID=153151 RepID=A0A150MZG1_9BACL|nr:hypothetical protein B4110_3406 [Parageobacillus toebii]
MMAKIIPCEPSPFLYVHFIVKDNNDAQKARKIGLEGDS